MWRCEKASFTAPTYEQQYAMKKQSKQTLCKSGPPSNSVKKHLTPPIFLSIVLQLMHSPRVPHCLCLAVSHIVTPH